MIQLKTVFELTSNKKKRVSLVFNERLWSLFQKCCQGEMKSATAKIEELILQYLDDKNALK